MYSFLFLWILYVILLFSVFWAGADSDQVVSALVVETAVTAVVGVSSSEAFASVLHRRYEREAFVCVLGIDEKVWIYGNRIVPFAFSLSLVVVAIIYNEGFAVEINPSVKVAFSRS